MINLSRIRRRIAARALGKTLIPATIPSETRHDEPLHPRILFEYRKPNRHARRLKVVTDRLVASAGMSHSDWRSSESSFAMNRTAKKRRAAQQRRRLNKGNQG